MANPVMVRTAYLSSPKPRHLTRSNQFIAAAVGVCPFKASKHLYYSPLIVFNTHHCLSAVTPRAYLQQLTGIYISQQSQGFHHESPARELNLSERERSTLELVSRPALIRQRIHTAHGPSDGLVSHE